MSDSNDRYPIGRPRLRAALDANERAELINEIEATPANLEAALDGIAPDEWDRTYRDGGWTVRQVVHHIPDSHLNAIIRFKLALTEDVPPIKPYDEAAWARLPDVAGTEPEVSVDILRSLHRRWVVLLRGMEASDFERSLFHPEMDREINLNEMLCLYAWHGRHHVRHVEVARGHGEA